MNFLPACYFPHISIEEVNSLTEDEASMLLYICNVWAPIKLPECVEEHPITLNLIRYAQRPAVIGRVMQACSVVTEEGKPIYNGLREKLGIPNPPTVVEEPVKEQLNNGPTTGSVEIK